MTKKVQSLLNELKKETLRYKELLDERTKKLTSLKNQIDHELQKQYEKEYPKSASKTEIEGEVADIFFYLVRFCQVMDIDLEKAFYYKMRKNAEKYPNQIK